MATNLELCKRMLEQPFRKLGARCFVCHTHSLLPEEIFLQKVNQIIQIRKNKKYRFLFVINLDFFYLLSLPDSFSSSWWWSWPFSTPHCLGHRCKLSCLEQSITSHTWRSISASLHVFGQTFIALSSVQSTRRHDSGSSAKKQFIYNSNERVIKIKNRKYSCTS